MDKNLKKIKPPTISVLMAVFNCENYISTAIDSILNQSFTDFEFIIINDGSTDTSLDIINSFTDERIRVFNQENHGLAYSLNIGISMATGKYIARMDADDISLPERFQIQYNFMEKNTNVDVLGGAMLYVNQSGNYLGRSFSVMSTTILNYYLLHIDNVISHPTVLIRSSSIEKYGKYCSILFAKEDYHLWNKFLRKGAVLRNISKVLIKYRLLDSSMSSTNSFTRKNSEIFNKVLSEDNPSDNLIKKLLESKSEITNEHRNYNFDNLENKVFQILKIFIGYNLSEKIITKIKNIVLKFKYYI